MKLIHHKYISEEDYVICEQNEFTFIKKTVIINFKGKYGRSKYLYYDMVLNYFLKNNLSRKKNDLVPDIEIKFYLDENDNIMNVSSKYKT